MRYAPRVFGKRWFELHQASLLWWANTIVGRFILGIPLRAPRVQKLTPDACSMSNDRVNYKAVIYEGKQYANRLYFALKPFWLLLHALDSLMEMTGLNYNFGFDSATIYSPNGSDAYAGYAQRTSVAETWATIRAGAGNAYGAAPGYLASLGSGGTSSQYNTLARGIITFKLSSVVPAGAKAGAVTISSGTVSVYGTGKANSLGTTDITIVSAAPASNTALVAADFTTLGTTVLASNITYANYSTSAYNAFSLNSSGIANIDTTATHARFGFRLEWDRSGTFGGTWASYVWSHYTYDSTTNKYPKLDLTYTVQPAPTLTSVMGGSAGNGYIGANAVLGGADITSKRLEVSTTPTFASTEVDTGSVSETVTSGNPVAITTTWASPSAGTHYLRIGVESQYYNMVWSDTVILQVAFPTIDSVVATQSNELLTITSGVTDTYVQPPGGTVYVDDTGYPMEISDRGQPSYQYRATVPVSRGQHSIMVSIANAWATVESNPFTFASDYELNECSAAIYSGSTKLVTKNIQLVLPSIPSLPSCTFDCDSEVTGNVVLVVRSKGFHQYRFTVTQHRKSGAWWSITCEDSASKKFSQAIEYSVKQSTSWEIMQDILDFSPDKDYSDDLAYSIYSQLYSARVIDIVSQLLVQNGVRMWVADGKWHVASLVPSSPTLGMSKDEAVVGYSSDDKLYNRVKAHYYIRQYPVPDTALTEYDAAQWTGTVTDVTMTDLNLLPPSGARYMLRSDGNITRASLSAILASFDRLYWRWLPETATSMSIKLKQDASNYLSYTRTFGGSRGAGFIVSGSSSTGTATKTISASIRVVNIQGLMTKPCSVKVELKRAGVVIWTQDYQQTQGQENHWQAYPPASIYTADPCDTIVLTFTSLYPVNAGYGVNCTNLTITEWKQVAQIGGTTRTIISRHDYTTRMGIATHDTSGGTESWGMFGTVCDIPILESGQDYSVTCWGGSADCDIADYDNPNGKGYYQSNIPVNPSISNDGLKIYAGLTISTDAGYAGADGQIMRCRGGTASVTVTVGQAITAVTYVWQAVSYAWQDSYNLWDTADIPLTSFIATGTPKTVTSIEITCSGIAYWDAIMLYSTNPLDQVVEVSTPPADTLYTDEGQQYRFNSAEAAIAWAKGMLDMLSVSRKTYQKTMAINDDISVGDWVSCDGDTLQVTAITYNFDDSTEVVQCGEDTSTLFGTIRSQASEIDLLKRQ